MKLINSPLNSIDYENHPGFLALGTPGRQRSTNLLHEDLNKQMLQIVDSIDTIYLEYVNSEAGRSPEADQGYANRLRKHLLALKETSLKYMPEGGIAATALNAACEMVFKLLVEEALVRKALKNNVTNSERFGPAAEETCEQLRREGVALCRIPQNDIEAIWNATAPFRARLAEIRAKEPTSRNCNISIAFDPPHGPMVLNVMKESLFLEALALFYNCEIEPFYCAIQLSHPTETWYKSCYEDVGLPTSRFAYAHYDSGFELCKMILYLNEVGAENGPFTYVPKSRVPEPSPFLLAFSKCLDHGFRRAVNPEIKKRAGNYHRFVFKLPELRKEFLQLPPVLRLTSHFGDDIADWSGLGVQLQAGEQAVTTDLGNCMVFDGDKTMHRGGSVHSGERWVLNMGIRIRQFSGMFQKI